MRSNRQKFILPAAVASCVVFLFVSGVSAQGTREDSLKKFSLVQPKKPNWRSSGGWPTRQGRSNFENRSTVFLISK